MGKVSSSRNEKRPPIWLTEHDLRNFLKIQNFQKACVVGKRQILTNFLQTYTCQSTGKVMRKYFGISRDFRISRAYFFKVAFEKLNSEGAMENKTQI